jgi:hypothetical protein
MCLKFCESSHVEMALIRMELHNKKFGGIGKPLRGGGYVSFYAATKLVS